jgi:hypothetical protein
MKHMYFILILVVSRVFSQVGPPDLRCLEVLSNGDVKLTWIPPSDPNNSFNSYEVYYSTIKTNTYALVSLNLNAITATSFTHALSSATVQGCYYYMVTTYGSGGTSSSVHSDTLKTLFFNAVSGITALHLTFNHLHIPPLPSTASTYTIAKEYPAGTWKNLTVTSGNLYPDTISSCVGVELSYQATVMDASGCISVSNIQHGKYFDSKAPEMPYVDSISVLPNGNTVLAWQIPIDGDVDRYRIQYRTVAGTNVLIDSLSGRNNTLYTYTTTTANSDTVGLYVQALDSCGSGGVVDYNPRTMYLTTAYNRCAYSTHLTWNNYRWTNVPGKPKQEFLEYRIYYSVNGSAFTVVGTTTDSTFTHLNAAPSKNICYFIRAFSKAPTITSSSNRVCFFSDQVTAPNYLYTQTASILSENSAFIKFYLDTSVTSVGIDVQRSEADSNFTSVGFVPFTGGQFYNFTDETIDSKHKSYYYKGVVHDSCGNVRLSSNKSKTVLLRVTDDKNNMFTKYLNWNSYSGFDGGVSGYNIYRIVDEGHNESLVGTTGPLATSFTDDLEDAAPDGAKIDYRVQAVEGLGNVYGFQEISNSNFAPVYVEGRLFIPNAFAPSGENKTWLPITHFIDKSEYHVRVFNRWGGKVFETSDDSKAWNGENCPPDVYVYLIDFKNARGEYKQVKGEVLLIR